MNTPPPPPPLAPPFSDHILEMELPSHLDEWSNLLDFTFHDQFDLSWSPDHQTTTTSTIPTLDSVLEASNRGGSDSSDKIRKRDPRLTCENFLAGRIPCACPELDAMLEEEVEVGKKRMRKASAGVIRCQVPRCGFDISELKGYHKRHRVCLGCANASSVVIDGESKRYCQQCGKFHILPDFDEGKRSCRRKLERHNKRRRRKPADFRGAIDKDSQIGQLGEDIACEDKSGKDENPNESEDGNVSPRSSQFGSQSIQSESIKSFVTFGETQMEGGKDNSKCSSDNKNAYSSMCPTGRISFKLYDWNPAEFPRRLRHQIFQWLANMPVELEGYIRPGCTILTLFIAMPQFMWEKLSEDAMHHIHDFLSARESMLFRRGSMTIYLNDMIFRVLKGETSLTNVKTAVLAPRIHYVHPSWFEAGKPIEFVVCGSNLTPSKFRFLVSFAGRYLAHDVCHAIPDGGTGSFNEAKEDSSEHLDHQIYKIHISTTDPTLSGPAFIEVENEFGISNFIPILFGDKFICSEMKVIQQRLSDALFSKEIQHEPCKDFGLKQAAISELILDVGWLLKELNLDDIENHFTFTQIQRFNCLLGFLIQNESTAVLEKVLHSLKIVMDAKKFYNHDDANNNANMNLFQKNVEHAREIVHQKHQDSREQVLFSGSLVENVDFLAELHIENDMDPTIPSTSEDMEIPKMNNYGSITTAFRESAEVTPLLNKEVVMNMRYEPHPVRVRTQKTYTRFLSTALTSRPLVLMVAAVVVCSGVCAVLIHPNKVGDLAVTIRRCLFGHSET